MFNESHYTNLKKDDQIDVVVQNAAGTMEV